MKRLDSYRSSLSVLSRASEQDLSNEFIQGGIIDKFSIQFELGWKLLKDLLAFEGEAAAASGSPRDALKAAYRCFGFVDEELWLRMLRARNEANHIYDGENALALVHEIINDFTPEFQRVEQAVIERYGDDLKTL